MNKTISDKKNSFSLKERIIRLMAHNPFRAFNYRQLSKQLGITDKDMRKKVQKVLSKILAEGIIIEDKRGKYRLDQKYIVEFSPDTYLEGIVDMKKTGKAYVIVDGYDEDIFIEQGNTGKALPGDLVKVFLFPKRKKRKREGQITEVIKRNKTRFVGRLEVGKQYAFLIPDHDSMPVDLFIPLNSLNGAISGEKVIAEITDWPDKARNPFGQVLKVLGKPGDNNVEMQSILLEYGLPLEFPDEVLEEVKNLPSSVPFEAAHLRENFKNVKTFTIDPKDAKDFDDALSIQELPNGNISVGVHIADVSYFVKPGSAIDKEAMNRATSVYLVDRVVPMLPEKLSNGLCSLVPNEDRLAFSVMLEIDDEMVVRRHWVCRSIINSDRRYTYEEVQKVIIGEEKEDPNAPELLTLNNIAIKLRKKRFHSGSINMESTEVRFLLDDNGKPIDVYIREHNESHQLVEEFMLLANRTIAKSFGVKKNTKTPRPFVYRVHDEPNGEKIGTLSKLVHKLGYRLDALNRESLNQGLNKLLTEVKGKGEQTLIERLTLRAMAKAIYTTENIGHYGLGFSHYTHFTSPIRRYPDLLVHRLVWEYMGGRKYLNQTELEELCDHASIMERRAQEAERASVKYKQAEYMSDKIGEVFCGVISGVSKWGVFVEMETSFCEGMIRMHDLDDDFYYLDEENYQVTGQRHGNVFRLGDKIKVRVKHVDINARKIDLQLVDDFY